MPPRTRDHNSRGGQEENGSRGGYLEMISHWLESKLTRRRLLDIPRGCYWRVYNFCSHGHIVCTCVFIVLSVSCFCTGFQNSFMYDEVNCSDGTSLVAPLVNVVLVYYALMALKQQGNYFIAFEYAVISLVVFFINGFFAADQLLMGIRWLRKKSRTDHNWPLHFAVMDLLMAALLVIMEVAILGVIFVYTLLLTDWGGWRRRAQRSVERAEINRQN